MHRLLVLALVLGSDPALARLAESLGDCAASATAVQADESPGESCPPAPHDCGDGCACLCCCAHPLAAQRESFTLREPRAVRASSTPVLALVASDDLSRPFRPPIA